MLRTFVLAIALTTCFRCGFHGEAFAQQVVQRDAQALSILSQTLSAAGGASVLGAIQDFTESGNITYYWAPKVSGAVTIQGRGQGQFRIDSTLPDGVRSLVVNNGSGSITETDGSETLIPQQGAVNLGSMTFPLIPLLAAVQDDSINVTYVGLTNHLGAQVHDIQIQKTYSPADPAGAQSKTGIRDFYIDPNSFSVLSIFNLIDPAVDGSGGTPHEVIFGDYQVINGISTPLWITESIRDQSLLTIQLNQVLFNTNLTDNNFTL